MCLNSLYSCNKFMYGLLSTRAGRHPLIYQSMACKFFSPHRPILTRVPESQAHRATRWVLIAQQRIPPSPFFSARAFDAATPASIARPIRSCRVEYSRLSSGMWLVRLRSCGAAREQPRGLRCGYSRGSSFYLYTPVFSYRVCCECHVWTRRSRRRICLIHSQ